MSQNKMISIALIIIGIGLCLWGYQLSGGLGSQLNQMVTGSYTDKVMIVGITGVISLVFGLIMFTKTRR